MTGNSSLAGSLLAMVLPLALFVMSLRAVFMQGSATGRSKDFSGVLWTGAFMMVNALSCFWSATILSSMGDSGRVPPHLVAVTLDAGVYLFATLVGVLYARSIPGLASTASAHIGKRLKAPFSRRKKDL